MSNGQIPKDLLIIFKEKFNKELDDCDFSAVCCDYDILDSIKEYADLSDMAEKDKVLKDKIEKAEKAVLRIRGLIKLTKEDNLSFYLKRGEAYDSEGNLIEDMFDEYLENEDLFCDYINDETYDLMKKNVLSKLKHMYKDEY